MDKDITLWLVFACLIAFVAFRLVRRPRKNVSAEAPLRTIGNSLPVDAPPNPEISILKISAQICVDYDLLRSSDYFSSAFSAEDLLYILPYIYLLPIIRKELFGKDSHRLAAITAYLSHKEAEKYNTPTFLNVVLRTTYIQSAALTMQKGFPEQFSFDLSSKAVDHFRGEIEEIVNHYSPSPESLKILESHALPLWAYIAGFEKTHAQYDLEKYRRIRKFALSQLENNPLISNYLEYANLHKPEFDEFEY